MRPSFLLARLHAWSKVWLIVAAAGPLYAEDLPAGATAPESNNDSFAVVSQTSVIGPAPQRPPTAPSRPLLAQTPTASATSNRPATGQHRIFSLSSVPNMIGDTSGGGCGSLNISGVTAATISHPTFACSRLNIAENNSPVVNDRAYVTWRHFENASDIDIYSQTPNGGSLRPSIDRVIFGFERRWNERNSVELRIPVNAELNSDLYFEQLSGPRVTGTQRARPQITLPLHDTTTELGNINLVWKHEFVDHEKFYFSGGLGLNIPTAPNVRIRAHVDDRQFEVFDLTQNPPTVLVRTPVQLDINAVIKNQTFNLSPFLGAIYFPDPSWFVQAFTQLDQPLNPSQAQMTENVSAPFVLRTPINDMKTGNIYQQTLLRFNLSGGHWWIRNQQARWVKGLGTMLELHYSTTLTDARLLGPFEVIPANRFTDASLLTVGNLDNRVDVLNFVVGVPLQVRKTLITNAYVVPLKREGRHEGFDYEYTLLINRYF